MIFDTPKSAAMERSLSALWQRTQMIATNLANADTPGYKGKKIAFEGMLQNELRAAEKAHGMTRSEKVSRISSSQVKMFNDPSLSVRADGNNVNLDNEQIEIARTQLQYQALKEKINGHYTSLKYAISGGR
jgi:flagellar basal-body rod protein FlgB